jgi:hypothetical protein
MTDLVNIDDELIEFPKLRRYKNVPPQLRRFARAHAHDFATPITPTGKSHDKPGNAKDSKFIWVNLS